MLHFQASNVLILGINGAHDADRTRDLVLTKDVLYQLSYMGFCHDFALKNHRPLDATHPPKFHPVTKMERAMGFEPTTASLEGWNSTTELRPQHFLFIFPFTAMVKIFRSPIASERFPDFIFYFQKTPYLHYNRTWWAGKGSNLGSRWQQIYSLPPLTTWVPAHLTK